MRSWNVFIATTLVLGLAGPGMAGNVVLTVSGTVTDTDPGMGYTVGDPVSFS